MSCGKLIDTTNQQANKTSSSPNQLSTDITSSLWGQPRLVILNRQPNKSLGISIVGGKLDVCSSNNSTASGSGPGFVATSPISQVNSFISGIFIKHVLENSPAGLNGTLKTGDRILAVNDIDLTQATHDRAVEVIRNAKSPVKFLIQSLICVNNYTPTCDEDVIKSNQPTTPSTQTQSQSKNQNEKPLNELVEETNENEEEINESSSSVDQTKQIIDEPNKYDYSLEAMTEKYNYLLEGKEPVTNQSNTDLSSSSSRPINKSKLYIFKLKRNFANESLGLSLSGNVNLNKTSVFVCGIYANSIAHRHGLIKVGDQILEINGQMIYGRAHSNVTPLIKNIKELDVYLVILRSSDNLTQMFKPTHQFHVNSSGSLSPSQKSTTPLETSIIAPSLSIQAPIAISTNSASNKTSSQYESTDISSACISNATNSLEKRASSQITIQPANKVIRKIELKKGPTGFGIAISEDRFNRLIVRGLNSNGVAFQDGRMQVGDEIIAVNSFKVSTMKYDEVMNLLHTTQDPVEFQVSKPDVITTCSSSIQSTTGSLYGSNNTSCSASSTTSPQTGAKQHNKVNRSQSNITSEPALPNTTNQTKAATDQPVTQSKESTPSQPHHQKVTFDLQHDKYSDEKESNQNNQKSQTSELTKQKLTSQSSFGQLANDDPKTNQIKVGEETWIEIERGKLGLGLSIVGGSDTQLPGIIIHDIYQNGAAYRDKRLSIGDQILKVNSIDLINATHEQALNALRQTSEFVKLLIHRGFQPNTSALNEQIVSPTSKHSYNDPNSSGSAYSFAGFAATDDEKFLNIIYVELNKKFAKGLGFSIIGRRDGTGVFISHIIEGGCAHKDGRLMIGDLILEVNGQDIRKSAYNDVAFLLKTLPQGKVVLKVGRFKTSATPSVSSSINASANASASGSKSTSRRNSNADAPQFDNQQTTPNVSTFKPIIKK